MGAGEQRVFRILDIIINAPKYSLIVIDEIDLTIHTNALNKLLDIIIELANENSLQIIFTSHREELLTRTDINFRHIHQTPEKTLYLENTNPDCIKRLTGDRERCLEIFVEDDLSKEIVSKVLEEERMIKHTSVRQFGSIGNSYTLASGIILKGNKDDLLRTKIITDGDVDRTENDKINRIKKCMGGTEIDIEEKRKSALSLIDQYVLPDNMNPEQYIHYQLNNLSSSNEIVESAKGINVASERHEYVNQIIDDLGYEDRRKALSKIIEEFSKCEGWISFTKPIKTWLEMKKKELELS